MNKEVRFIARRELSLDVFEYTFECVSPVEFVSGQYAKFWFPDSVELGSRTFTLTSMPGETIVKFIVRFPNPMSDYKRRLLRLEHGDIMNHDEPMGDAILPRNSTTPLIFITQGIAIASYVSILAESKQHNLDHVIQLHWTRRDTDTVLRAVFESSLTERIQLQQYSSSQNIDVAAITRGLPDDTLIYISGSQTFVENLGTTLEKLGILRERIIFDYYEGYATL